MKLLNLFKTKLESAGHCSSSYILAQAGASACSEYYKFNMFEASYKLDSHNKWLVTRLVNIAYEDDFCDKAQFEFIQWLKKKSFLD